MERPPHVTAEAWRQAKVIVATWPALTDQQNAEITALAVAHQRRKARERMLAAA